MPTARMFAAALLVALPCLPAGAATSSCRVDRTHYTALHKGMTYRSIAARLGCPGRRISHLTIGDTHRATYSWSARGTYGANVTLTFRNGRLTDKSQLGLH